MDGLCTGIGWTAEGLSFEIRDKEKYTQLVAVGDELALGVKGARECIGSRPPGSKSLTPCPDHFIGVSRTQCSRCVETSMLLPCHLCNGERCANPERRSDCVQPENHAVYLASFGPGNLKIGVARWTRRAERVFEQGARAALIIAQNDGQKARRIEHAIKRCGIKDRYSHVEKIAAYHKAGSPEDLLPELFDKLSEMQVRLEFEWLDEPQVLTSEIEHLSQMPDQYVLSEETCLRGEVLKLYGTMLLLRTDYEATAIIDARDIVGWRLRSLATSEGSTGQLTLAFS